ncbi:hypothetical protein [Ralstonia sp. ASV6]|uniref:hypothetical protein n=1 Tax=Ralstonia sp. ASV6 TaxID=2795124 RepID=UPI0018EDA96E|nr:hypothetical protein [Ralstonia sp. ASV6]
MSMKKMAADGQIKKVDKYRVPLGMLNGNERNLRLDMRENRDHVDAIYASLCKQFETDLEESTEEGHRFGSMQMRKGSSLCTHDMKVVVDENDRITVIDGNMSLRALLKAKAAGKIDDRFLVDVVTESVKEARHLALTMLRCGQGKNPNPLEVGLKMKELRDGIDGSEPMSVKEIAAELGRTAVSVRELLKLADADERIHDLIVKGKVGAHVALDAIKSHPDGDAFDYLQKNLAKAEESGKTRLTTSVMKGRSLPRKLVNTAITTIESFHAALDSSTRRQLAELEKLSPEQATGKKVEVDAALLLDLLKAGASIDDERKKLAAKAENDAAAAKQGDLIAEEA